MSGYVTYVNYVAGKDKGQTQNGDLFNSPFALGNVNPNYTSDKVVETFVASQTALAWTPVQQGQFTLGDESVADVKVTRGTTVKYGTFASAAVAGTGTLAGMTFKNADGTADTDSFTLTAGDKIAYVYKYIVHQYIKYLILKLLVKPSEFLENPFNRTIRS